MNKRVLVAGIAVAAAIAVMFSVAAFSFTDDDADEFAKQPWNYPDKSQYNMSDPDPDSPNGAVAYQKALEETMTYQMFENLGPVLIVLGLLMFGAIIAGVYIAKEDDDHDSD